MTDSRRDFLKQVSVSAAASLLPLKDVFAFNREEERKGFVVNEHEQEIYLIGPRRAPVTFMMDKNSRLVDKISLCREEMVPDDGIPIHKHLNEEELIYIDYGTGLFTLGDKEYEVQAGSVAYVPKGIWHGLRNTGTGNLRMVFSFTPSGFENYFREIGVPKGAANKDLTDAEWTIINEKYGIVYKGG